MIICQYVAHSIGATLSLTHVAFELLEIDGIFAQMYVTKSTTSVCFVVQQVFI